MAASVPVVGIDRENLAIFWPSVVLAIRNANFIAIDMELSGLGDRRQLAAKSIDDRYKSIAATSACRSVLSVGLSCFSKPSISTKPNKKIPRTEIILMNQTFNFLTLCEESFTVEPDALRFLIGHGFDFNSQYARGLPYRRGNDVDTKKQSNSFTVRDLLKEIIKAKKPVVLHNGLIDLVFLYGNFLAELPATLQTFVADLCKLFPGGIYDTKFVADFCARFPSSFLEYVFRKCQRDNDTDAKQNRQNLVVQFTDYAPSVAKFVENAVCKLPDTVNRSNADAVCLHFANHGYCKDGLRCQLSHDIDAILDVEVQKVDKQRAKRQRRQKRRQAAKKAALEARDDENDPSSTTSSDDSESEIENPDPEQDPIGDSANDRLELRSVKPAKVISMYSGAHRAGYDAFMTGFSMAFLTLKQNGREPSGGSFSLDVPLFKNKIALSGKEHPLFIQSSSFAKPSKRVMEIVQSLEDV